MRDPLSDFEERRHSILGVVGAVVAELSEQPNARLCHLGIGALLRFRTLLDNPKLYRKAIMVVVAD